MLPPCWRCSTKSLGGSRWSTISAALSLTSSKSIEAAAANDALDFLKLDIRDFTRLLAEVTSALLPYTKPFGLSFGNQACLALAKMEKVIALTGNRAWQQVQETVGVKGMLIR